MAAPTMSRHRMKQDDLANVLGSAGGYLSKHPTGVRNILIAAGAVVVLGLALYAVFASRSAKAAELLREGQVRFSARAVGVGANPSAPLPTYPSEAERDRAALDSFTRLVASYPGTREGRLGRYYLGILQAKVGKSDEALTTLEAFVADPASPLLGSLAKAQLAQVRAQKGDLEGAARAYSELAEAKDGGVPRDWALLQLANTLQAQGKHAEAGAARQKLIAEFPTSILAGEARSARGGPSPTAPQPAPAPPAASPPPAAN